MRITKPTTLNMIVDHKSQTYNSETPHYAPDYGFTNYTGSKSVTEFKKTVIIPRNPTQLSNTDTVQHTALEIVHDLAKELIESRVPVIETSENPEDSTTSVTVKMKIAPPDVTFASVKHDTFFLDGENFTEKEIAYAIKIIFPERFI